MPTHAPMHRLTQVDYEHRTAICSVCGSVKITLYRHRNYDYLNRRCINAKLLQSTQGKIRRHAARLELINKYKLRNGCKQCGYRSPDPKEFRLFEIQLPRQEKIAILAWDSSRERLQQELAKRDVYCRKCYQRMRKQILSKTKTDFPMPASI